MFCENCGAPIENGAKFCSKCGTKVDPALLAEETAQTTETQAAETPAPETPAVETPAPEAATSSYFMPAQEQQVYSNPQPEQIYAAPQEQQEEAKVKAPKEKGGCPKIFKSPFFYIGIGVLVAAIVAVVIILMMPSKINVEDYVTVEFSGYDGYGKANVKVDKTALSTDAVEKTGIADDVSSLSDLLGGSVSKVTLLRNAISSIKCTPDKKEGLKNGDEVTVEITYDNEIANEVKLEFSGSSVKATVSGLNPVKEVDAFEGLEITYSGKSPNGKAAVKYSGSDLITKYNFKLDKSSKLKNGDVVTVTFTPEDKTTLAKGFVVKNKTKTFTVSGLTEYPASINDIDKDYIEKLKKDASDVVEASAAKKYGTNYKMSKPEYVGYTYLYEKEGNSAVLYLVYKANVTGSENQITPVDVFYPVKFSGITKSSEGFAYQGDATVYGNSSYGKLNTIGYVNIAKFFDSLAKVEDEYDITIGDGFEKYKTSDASISKLADISQENKDNLKKTADAVLNNYLAKGINGIEITDVEYAGDGIAIHKDQTVNIENRNRYYMFYFGTVTYTNGKYEPQEVCFVVEFDGLTKSADGNITACGEASLFGRDRLENSATIQGYVDSDKFSNELVTANVDKYQFEISDDFLGE